MDPFSLAMIITSLILGGTGLIMSAVESDKNDDRYEEQQEQYAAQVKRAEEQYAEQMRMAQEQNDRYEAELLKQTVESDVNTGDLESTAYGRAQQANTNATNAIRLGFIHSFGKTNRAGFKRTSRSVQTKEITNSNIQSKSVNPMSKIIDITNTAINRSKGGN